MLCKHTQPVFYADLLYAVMRFSNCFECDCNYINGFVKVGGLHANVVGDTAHVSSRSL
jgi:hypothetical protein